MSTIGFLTSQIRDRALCQWRFDETSGTTAHEIMQGANGTYAGTYTMGVSALCADASSAVSFSGGYCTLDITDPLNSPDDLFAIEFIIQPADLTQTGVTVLGNDDADVSGHGLRVVQNAGYIDVWINGVHDPSAAQIPLNPVAPYRTYIAFQYGGTVQPDGIEQWYAWLDTAGQITSMGSGTTTYPTGSNPVYVLARHPLTVAANYDGSSPWSGTIQGLALYNKSYIVPTHQFLIGGTDSAPVPPPSGAPGTVGTGRINVVGGTTVNLSECTLCASVMVGGVSTLTTFTVPATAWTPPTPGTWTLAFNYRHDDGTQISAPGLVAYIGKAGYPNAIPICNVTRLGAFITQVVDRRPLGGVGSANIQAGAINTTHLGFPFTLSELHDVSITAPANNQTLTYSTALSGWMNNTPASSVSPELASLIDVNPTISEGQFLGFNNANPECRQRAYGDFSGSTISVSLSGALSGSLLIAYASFSGSTDAPDGFDLVATQITDVGDVGLHVYSKRAVGGETTITFPATESHEGGSTCCVEEWIDAEVNLFVSANGGSQTLTLADLPTNSIAVSFESVYEPAIDPPVIAGWTDYSYGTGGGTIFLYEQVAASSSVSFDFILTGRNWGGPHCSYMLMAISPSSPVKYVFQTIDLSSLPDVALTAPANNQVLTYSTALSAWKNSTFTSSGSGGGGGGSSASLAQIQAATSDIVHLWKCDDVSGSSLADSIGSTALTLGSSTTLGVAGMTPDGQTALFLKGAGDTNSQATASVIPTSGAFSLEMVVDLLSLYGATSGIAVLYFLGNTSNPGGISFNVRPGSGGTEYEWAAYGVDSAFNGPFPTGSTLLHTEFDGSGTLSGYVNGVLIYQATGYSFSNGNFLLGGYPGNTFNPTLKVQDIALYSRQLTQAEKNDRVIAMMGGGGSGGGGGGGSSALATDTDVHLTTPVAGQVLTYSDALSGWTNSTPASSSGGGGSGAEWYEGVGLPSDSLGSDGDFYVDLTPVFSIGTEVALEISAPVDGQVLTWNASASAWINTAPGGGGGGYSFPSTVLNDAEQYVDFSTAANGSAFDKTYNGNHCSYCGSPTIDADGLTTDGSTEWINPGKVLWGEYAFTIAVKLKTTDSSTNGSYWAEAPIYNLALNGTGCDGGMTIHAGYAAYWHAFSGGDYGNVSTTLINDGAWHTVVWTVNSVQYGASSSALYVDGAITSATNTWTGSLPFMWNWAGPLMGNTGLDFGSTPNKLAASFSKLAVWKRALSSAEAAALVL